MTEIQLLRPEGLVSSPAFSHVAVVPPGATTVYVGGQNAVDQNGELVGGTDVAAQTRQVMANLVTALQAAGAGIEHLVSVLVMLVEGVDVQAAYAAAAVTLGSAKTPPLVSAAIVSGLGVPGAMVEVSAIAATPDQSLQTERSGSRHHRKHSPRCCVDRMQVHYWAKVAISSASRPGWSSEMNVPAFGTSTSRASRKTDASRRPRAILKNRSDGAQAIRTGFSNLCSRVATSARSSGRQPRENWSCRAVPLDR